MKQNKNSGFLANWTIVICCFLLAVMTFFVVVYSGQRKRVVSLPLEVILPENYNVASNIPKSANLVIQGNENSIYLIDASCFSLSADFSVVDSEGVTSVYVNVDSEKLPDYVDLSDITIYTDPSWVKVYFTEK